MKNRHFEFKDFIYNFSDILTAVLIILVALLIIAWRVNAIMDYPQTMNDVQTEASQSSEEENTESADGADTDATSGTQQEAVTVTVQQNQTVTDIAQILVSAGVISDAQQFIDAVNAAGAATMLKYGTYTIPAGATPAEIVQLML